LRRRNPGLAKRPPFRYQLNLSYLLKLPDFLFIVADSLHICDV
jgi:hypothetical protein